MTLDGVDFPIYEARPFDPKWYSHKFKRAGMRYDVGVGINCGKICWHSGGFRCGEMNDLQIARIGICEHIPRGERIIADKGYKGERCVFETYPDEGDHPYERSMRVLLARHETVNKRIKDFTGMRALWRHGWRKHNMTFAAVVNVVEIQIENGNPFFNVLMLNKI